MAAEAPSRAAVEVLQQILSQLEDGTITVSVTGGGGGADTVDVTDRADRVGGHVVVDALPGAVAQSSDVQAVRDRLGALVGPAAGSVNAQLAAVLAELGQKVEAGDLAALLTEAELIAAIATLLREGGSVNVANFPATQPVSAAALPLPAGASTAARQDAEKATADAILASMPGVQAALDAIQTNTATEIATVQELSLTADQVQLNTDTLEGLLGTLNAKDFSTSAKQDALLAELLGKLEPADLAVVAQEATLADALTALNALTAKDYATNAKAEQIRVLLNTLTGQLPGALVGGRLSVDVGASALPAGAATQATLAAVLAALGGTLTVDTELSAAGPLATQATLAAVLAALQGTLIVDTELSAAGPLGLETTQAAINGKLPAALVGGRLDMNLGASGITLNVKIQDAFGNNADGASGSAGYPTAYNDLFNGATWDRQRSNLAGSALASAARTTTTSSADLVNYNGRGVEVIMDVTTVPGSAPSLTVTVETKDPVSGKYLPLVTSAALVAVGTTRLRVYPGVTVAANLAVSDILARTFRVTVTHGNANSVTYSVGYNILM